MQADQTHYERAVQIIRQIEYVTLATVTPDGRPWNTPVHYTYDDQLSIFWYSDKDSQHSTNVRATTEAFAMIYDSTQAEGTGQGVYLQCSVTEFTTAEDAQHGRTIIQARKGKTIPADDYKKFTGDAVRRVYRAIPEHIWMNDTVSDGQGNYGHDTRVELDIAKLQDMLATSAK